MVPSSPRGPCKTGKITSNASPVTAAAASGAFYVGLLSSRKKWASLKAEVATAVGEAAAERVRAPVGLDLGARSPGEIAVAVVAEVIAAWRRG